jgi:hypothetical protein
VVLAAVFGCEGTSACSIHRKRASLIWFQRITFASIHVLRYPNVHPIISFPVQETELLMLQPELWLCSVSACCASLGANSIAIIAHTITQPSAFVSSQLLLPNQSTRCAP